MALTQYTTLLQLVMYDVFTLTEPALNCGGKFLNQDLGNHDTKVCDCIGCFPPGGKSLN